MKGKVIILFFSVLVFLSCRNESNKTVGSKYIGSDTIQSSLIEKPGSGPTSGISWNIASPVEIANLLQKLNIPFSQDYLASSIDADRQGTSFDKAIKLGILGADLGYLNIYEKTGSSLDVLSSIRKLAEDLKVSQFFDFELIKRLSQSKVNLDSLMFISTESYTDIDNYLKSDGRGQLSALMMVGVWIEGQYLATQVVSRTPGDKLIGRIGEQKLILNDLQLLLNPYCNKDKEFNELCNDIEEIKNRYSDVKIKYLQGEPLSVEKNSGLEIVQTEKSEVEMSAEQLKGIIEITKKVRNRLIMNN